jgi:hypothetical protein
MIHAANGSITQHFDSPGLFEFSWTKDVIDSTIVNCSIAGCTSKVSKVAQDVTV